MSSQLTLEPSNLLERWAALREAEPRLRQRDAATRLGVSEADLIAAQLGAAAVRLTTDWPAIFEGIATLGPVMALTRNDSAVIEKTGPYAVAQFHGRVGTVLGEAIDLRIFLSRWHVGFALVEETPRGTRRSLQFFNQQGEAVHKVFQTGETDASAFDALIARFTSAEQHHDLALSPKAAPKAEKPDAEVDVEALRKGWEGLQDTHDFVNLLKETGVSRTQAMRLVGHERARPVGVKSQRQACETAVATQLPIMVFVGNPGMIEIHTGPINKLVQMETWFNILDPGFNLHLDEAGVTHAWVVRKPTRDGIVTSLELFDAEGEVVALFFGKRKPGNPELEAWREVAASLPTLAD